MSLERGIAYDESVFQAVRSAWRTALPWQEPREHESWADAGGDSLEALKLLVQIETRLGCRLPHDLIDMDMTPISLSRRIEAYRART